MRIELRSGTPAEVVGSSDERGLVLVPDIMGLRPLFDEMAARLAEEWQCCVVAPELYPGQEHLDLEGRFAAAASLTDGRVLGDMTAAADRTGAATVAAIGFCMGGMYVNKVVSTGRFDRLVSFYGMIHVPDGWRGPGQGEPLEHLSNGDPSCLLAVTGAADPYTPAEGVAELRASGVQVVEYDEAEHGFVHDPARPAHRPADAADAWQHAARWLWQLNGL
ncbi:MAG: dienelactone hydrolase family protein [Acidimicrobiaceae bacterium]|nr:dienelactone hydrolase family protein [Acidimicrobiaceae bacterium]